MTFKLHTRPNPFTPTANRDEEMPSGLTVRECLRHADMADGLPAIVSIDGVWVLQAEWERPIESGAHVVALRVVAGGKNAGLWTSIGMIVAGIVVTVATWGTGSGIGVALIAGGVVGLASSLLIQTPRVPSSLQFESGSPSYSQDVTNRRRIGEPIPVLYGKHRLVPDLIANPYTEYADNDQYLYLILCLGNGEFQIDEVRIAESTTDRFTNFTSQTVAPGGALTLFPDNVTTSSLVQGQLLRPTNDVNRLGNGTVTITGASKRITPVGNPTLFSGVSPGDTIALTNCTNAQTRVVTVVGAGGSYVEFGTGVWVDEVALSAGVARTLPSPVVLLAAGDVSFTAGTKNIVDGTLKRFIRWKPGDVITITNTAGNNQNVTLATIFSDGSSATVVENIVNESNANPSFVLSNGGYIGPFPVNAPGTVLGSIGLDFIFPKGLTDNGSGTSVIVENQARPIDSTGAALAGWTTLGTETIDRNSLSPVRVSFKYTKPAAYDRWEVRVRRTTSDPYNANKPQDCDWAGLRGYLPNVGTYPGVTVYAVRVKATEQIPSDVARQFNIVATRKLPTWNGTTWSANVATRSPAWALADVLRSTAYGASLADGRIDLAKLLALDAVWAARGDYFDGVFDQTITIWETLQRISRAGRATPLVSGGLVTFVRDQASTIRTALYSAAHMKRGSLSIEYSFRQADDPDGVEVAWIDPSTWHQAHLSATVSGAAPLRPANVDLFGVTSQAQALREATYLARVDAYQRKVIRFTTEMDGHIPIVGDLIAISHDVPAWGQSGSILAVAGGRYRTTEPLTWTSGATHYAAFRRPNGSLAGPFVVLPVTGDLYTFDCATVLDFAPRTDLSNGDRTAYLFGAGTNWAMDVKVTRIAPRSETEVEITCQPYDARIHAAGA